MPIYTKKSNILNLRQIIIFALLILVAFKIFIPAWHDILEWNVPDTDDAMRILEVRAWLHGQGFYDLFNHRLNPPNGGDMHWSRIADLPLAFFEVLFTPFLGADIGEKLAVFITPPALLIVFLFIASKAAFSLYQSKIAAGLMIGFSFISSGILSYFVSGRVDHHNIQLICLGLTIYGLLKDTKLSTNLASLGIALSLGIGFENLPIIAVFISFVALKWLFKPQGLTIEFCKSLAIFIIIALLINIPIDKILISKNDALSIAQVLPILIGSFGLGIGTLIASKQKLYIRAFALLLVAIIVILTALQFPVLRMPFFYQTEEFLQNIWIKTISETIPLLKKDLDTQLSYGLFPLFTTIATVIKLLRLIIIKNKTDADFNNLSKWSLLSVGQFVCFILLCFVQSRFAGQTALFSALCASAILAEIYTKYGLNKAIIFAILLNSFTPNLIVLFKNKITNQKQVQVSQTFANCNKNSAFAHLRNFPNGKILGPIDFGARALLNTEHTVLAAPYHRNQGNGLAYKIFMADKKTAYNLIIENKIDYIGFCNKSAEITDLIRFAPNGLMAKLQTSAPEYLQEVARPQDSNIVFYRVIKQK